ncbi:MAG: endopeptidase La [Acidobacteriia bacterium]|nr:endopeptidase La [Terriglobia bacterium]
MSEQDEIRTVPLLPIKNTVLFPHLLLPLSIGRPSSAAAVAQAMAGEEKQIVIVTQRDVSVDDPRQKDLFTVGTIAVIKKMGRRPDGVIEMVVHGIERVTIVKVEEKSGALQATVRKVPAANDGGAEVEALLRAVLDLAQQAIALAQPQATAEMARLMLGHDDPLKLVYLLGSVLNLEVEKEQALLEASTRLDALRLMHTYLSHEVQVLELRNKIASEAETEIGKEQREYLLRQQMRAIQQELGEQSPDQAESQLLQDRLAQADLPDEVRKEGERELKRLQKLPPAAPDYHVIRSYLELVLDLPWRKRSEETIEIARARKVLDDDHYDLKEVKERILEQLGVLKMNPQAKAPILCFVGPPGTGKTSLGQSIARAMGRKFERMSLGGLHDEAELRGHRRTYIGAMPGRIIEAIRKCGVNNPLLMLDEVDKLGQDFRGDPASALLEILDPEQNKNFHDNYLDLSFDLSKVFFITTANNFDTIPRPLLDRMEVLTLSGYSEEEKTEIARRYLIPRQMSESGLTSAQFVIAPEALRRVIERYTREAGLRQLERGIGRLAHKAALHFAEGKTEPVAVGADDLAEMLGPERFFLEQARNEMSPGVATGLAWTETGGDVLYVEAALLPESRGLTLTGHLGEVMQESARAAHSYIWSHCDELGISRSQFRKAGVHIHVPAGAIPKDGPSAGVTMASALASLYTEHPTRRDTAMTGEITLTGLVLPIGGVKEKVLAARRAGLRRIILPKENQKDLRELPDEVRSEMEFVFVERVKDVLAAAIPEIAKQFQVVPAA